jgi:hypothetical protein
MSPRPRGLAHTLPWREKSFAALFRLRSPTHVQASAQSADRSMGTSTNVSPVSASGRLPSQHRERTATVGAGRGRLTHRFLNIAEAQSDRQPLSDLEKGRKNMPLVQVVLVLIVVGVLLWLVDRFIPMASSIKSIMNAVVVIAVVLWLLNIFGLFTSLSAIHIGKP